MAQKKSILVLLSITVGAAFLAANAKANLPVQPLKPIVGSSAFGYRIHPITGIKSFHNGIDIAANLGTPIISPWDGVVSSKWYDSTNGYAIRIKHNNKYTTGYAHMLNATPNDIIVGSKVNKGNVIGYVGNTGSSTGAHLHFVVYDEAQKAIDPLKILG